jgi:hypothetical protein
MTTANAVDTQLPTSFGNYVVASAHGVNIAATGNAVVTLPLMGGGITNSGANVSSGVIALRRITIGNYSAGNLAALNVSVGQTNDGANLVAAAQLLSSITTNNMWQDLTLNATGNNTFLNGNVSQCLFLNIVANAVANGTVDITVQGSTFRT